MCRATLGGAICLYPCRTGCGRSEEKRERENLWIQLKATSCGPVKVLPRTKVIPTLRVLLAPGLPLFQDLLYCPVTKHPAPLLEDQLGKTDIPYLRWVGFPQQQTLRQGFECKELAQKPIFFSGGTRRKMGTGHRERARGRCSDEQADTQAYFPWGSWKPMRICPRGVPRDGREVGAILHLCLMASQHCHPGGSCSSSQSQPAVEHHRCLR